MNSLLFEISCVILQIQNKLSNKESKLVQLLVKAVGFLFFILFEK
jgi:hypothetical protein